MRNILRFFLCLVVAMAFTACSDRLDDYYTAEDLAGLKVHIQLPDYSRALVKTRALDKDVESISSVTVIAYNSDGGFISQNPVTMGTDGKITPSLPSGTATVAVVTNVSLTDDQCANLSSTFLTTTPDAKTPICWGSASVNDLLKSSDPTISLLRMTAKTTVQSSTTDFTLEGIKVYYTAREGSIAPATTSMTNGAVTSVTNQSGESFSANPGDYKSASQVFYETPAGKAFLIVKGKYKDTEGYYKVKFYDQSVTTSNTELPLLRNHNYIVTIKRVNEAGYSTEAGAVAGEAENRMTVDITDDNPPIVDMISCKDYELGVCAPLTTDGTEGTVNATVVSSYLNGSKVYDYTITGAPDWVTVGTATKTDLPTAAGTDGEKSSKGALCVIPITVAQNPTEKERTATLMVTAGDLTRTITVTQAGYDFLADDNRKVTFLNGTETVSENYFGDFLPAVNGVKAADNQGLARDHGLHFAAVEGNTYSYKIKKVDGDKELKVPDNAPFTVSAEGTNYTVTLANSKDDALWVSEFTITNKDNVTITYPVYHTGVLHEITGDIAKEWELGPQKTGWFYYGVVEVKGSNNTYRLLDRNIGATNNGFYSPATQATKENEGAKGAYMILTNKAQKGNNISDGNGITIYCKANSAPYLYVWTGSGTKLNGDWPGKVMSETMTIGGTTYYYQTFNESSINILFNNGNQKTEDIKDITASSFYWYDNNTGYKKLIFPDVPNIGDSYMPFSSYFKVPTESYVDDILPKEVETRHTKTGEAYNCCVIKTTGGRGSDVQPEEVYIPVTGYYEGTSYRNENHANIWTCTRLSDYQGFSAESPEYGLWFLYLDINGQKLTNSNIRIVNGSAGRIGINGNGVDAIYNALPVRGIHKK